jgi:hypothetical protein
METGRNRDRKMRNEKLQRACYKIEKADRGLYI